MACSLVQHASRVLSKFFPSAGHVLSRKSKRHDKSSKMLHMARGLGRGARGDAAALRNTGCSSDSSDEYHLSNDWSGGEHFATRKIYKQ